MATRTPRIRVVAAQGSTQEDQEAQGQPGALVVDPAHGVIQSLAPEGGPDRGEIGTYERIVLMDRHPPAMPPEPDGVWPFGLSRLTAMAVARDRPSLEAFDVMRLPPAIGLYRAELLGWLSVMERFDAANKNT